MAANPVEQEFEHHFITAEERDELVDRMLHDAGVELADLHRQAHEGRFDSDKLHHLWFVIDGLGRGCRLGCHH